jgi:DNA-directed RNA polymerase subunit M/transcription elongation factor TFIIS
MLSAHCSACTLRADDLCLGVGMSITYSFLQNELVYCGKCEHLTTAPRLYSPESFAEFVKRLKPQQDDSQWRDDLLRSVAQALHRHCPKCDTPWKILRLDDTLDNRPARPVKCPRCAKRTLRIHFAGCWD